MLSLLHIAERMLSVGRGCMALTPNCDKAETGQQGVKICSLAPFFSCTPSIAVSADSKSGSYLFSPLPIKAHGCPKEESFHAYLQGPSEVLRVN